MSAAAHEEEAMHAVRNCEGRVAAAKEQLPQHSSSKVLGGPCDVLHDVAALLDGLQRVLRGRQVKVEELDRALDLASEALQQQHRERQLLEHQVAVAVASSVGGGGSSSSSDKAVAAKMRKKFEQKLQQLVS
jgi:hypothetical protein